MSYTNKVYSWIKWLAVIVVCAICVLLLYIFLLHPLVAFCFFPLNDYRGMEHFSRDKLFEFERGQAFVDQFASFEFVEASDVRDFYYVDNILDDSVVYGKKPDVYAIDLSDSSKSEAIKESIIQTGVHCGTQLTTGPNGKAELHYYLMPSSSDLPTDKFVFVIGENVDVIWFLLITEIGDEDLPFKSYLLDYIFRWSGGLYSYFR